MHAVREIREEAHTESGESRSKRKRVAHKNARRSQFFAVTLPRCDLGRRYVYESLLSDCEAIIVSQEKHEDGEPHLHLYLHTRELWSFEGVRERIMEMFTILCDPPSEGDGIDGRDAFSINIQKCNNKANWIRYITKEDDQPLMHNVPLSSCHQSLRILRFIASNRTFDPCAAFVRQQPFLLPRLREMHSAYWNEQSRKEHVVLRGYRLGIKHAVPWVESLRRALDTSGHVYLYGQSGIGKTINIAAYIREKELWPPYVVYLPCGLTEFEFSNVSEACRFIIAGDAPSDYCQKHRSQLLTLCDRGYVSINVKCAPISQFVFSGQVIIVSNYVLPADEALARRFTEIHADEEGFQEIPQTEDGASVVA